MMYLLIIPIIIFCYSILLILVISIYQRKLSVSNALTQALSMMLFKANMNVTLLDTNARFTSEIKGVVPSLSFLNHNAVHGKRGDELRECKGQKKLTEMQLESMRTRSIQSATLSDFVPINSTEAMDCHAIVAPVSINNQSIAALSMVIPRTETDRKLSALAQERDQAEQSNKAKMSFLSMMSHEIRTPLNGVLGMVQTLALSPLTADQRDQLETMRRSGQALLRLVDSILDFSKLEEGKLDLIDSAFSLQQLIKDVLAVIQPKLEKQSNEIKVHIDPKIPALILGDVDRLYQILINLILNAVKFTSHGVITIEVKEVACTSLSIKTKDAVIEAKTVDHTTKIETDHTVKVKATSVSDLRIQTQQRTEMVAESARNLDVTGQSIVAVTKPPESTDRILKVTISDTGIGIDKRIQTQLFRPFHQADRTTTRMYGGTGLGLAICKSLVNMMHGDIGVISELGKGSTFWFTIPLIPAPPEKQERKSVRSPSKERGSIRLYESLHDRPTPSMCKPSREKKPIILIAEDNEVNQKVCMRMVESVGLTCDAVSDGEQAIDKLKEHPKRYAAVLMDIHMPVMDGLAATTKIRQWERESKIPNTPIIALTADMLEDTEKLCATAGMNAFLTKPLMRDRLREILIELKVLKE